jgi:hypothetical protein
MKIKALSIRQPWASLIAHGQKTVEKRSRPTQFRGDFLVCVSGRDTHPDKSLPRGVALCIVELFDCRPLQPGDCSAGGGIAYDPTQFAWLLRNVRPLKTPFPVKGSLSWFTVELP